MKTIKEREQELFEDEDIIACPNCGKHCFVMDDELQRHNMPKGMAFELVHCDSCCTYFKVVYKFIKTIKLVEDLYLEAGVKGKQSPQLKEKKE